MYINTYVYVSEKWHCQEDCLQILRTVLAHQTCHPAFSNRAKREFRSYSSSL